MQSDCKPNNLAKSHVDEKSIGLKDRMFFTNLVKNILSLIVAVTHQRVTRLIPRLSNYMQTNVLR